METKIRLTNENYQQVINGLSMSEKTKAILLESVGAYVNQTLPPRVSDKELVGCFVDIKKSFSFNGRPFVFLTEGRKVVRFRAYCG